MLATRPLCLLLCALGGEGGGVLSDWLIATARRAGFAAQKTSVPGVAQRTGATTYYVEVFPVPIAQLQGRKPVFSLHPVPGMVDALISSELMETVRQTALGMADAQHTIVVSSSARTLTTVERMQMGDGRFKNAKLLEVLRANSRELYLLDMTEVARETGTVVSAAMFGAVAACGVLPFAAADYEAILCAGDNPSRANLQGFRRAYSEVISSRRGGTWAQSQPSAAAQPPVALPQTVASRFPPSVQDVLTLGYSRVLDYQDISYAELYVQRLEQVLAAERASESGAEQSYATTREAARWLALWMSFEDIARVADLKLRASRRLRVRQQAKASEGDIVRIFDYFRPGISELADVLPEPMARSLLRRDVERRARSLASRSLPLILKTHTALGALVLRLLACLRIVRRRSHRHLSEQVLIEKWLEAVRALTLQSWECGFEMALCARLIKGYGAANERGKANLVHLLEHFTRVPHLVAPTAHAQTIAQARQAALADDAGKTFDQVLQTHGVPPRPVKTAPIHFVKRAGTPHPT
ncbi:MAG TPA: indolepyruvate oxidoreductase subunit beta family protein [Burkholderiaceae bacterium]|nr:indolepyruvate oxidoreductase subunit beta family protein [Burkholderiaceae bacterium]